MAELLALSMLVHTGMGTLASRYMHMHAGNLGMGILLKKTYSKVSAMRIARHVWMHHDVFIMLYTHTMRLDAAWHRCLWSGKLK